MFLTGRTAFRVRSSSVSLAAKLGRIFFCLLNGSLFVQVLGRECDTIVARPLKSQARSRWSLYGVYSQGLSTDTCALLRGSSECVVFCLRAKCGGMDVVRQKKQTGSPGPRVGCGGMDITAVSVCLGWWLKHCIPLLFTLFHPSISHYSVIISASCSVTQSFCQ